MAQQSVEKPTSDRAWTSPLVLSIAAAAVAGFLNIGATIVKATSDNDIEKIRSDNSLILEMVRGQTQEQSANNLKFIIDAGLISRNETRETLIKALGSSSLPGIAFLPYGLQLPTPPAYLRECAADVTVNIPDGSLSDGSYTRADVAELTARMRASELKKDRCADNWDAWYSDLLKISATSDG